MGCSENRDSNLAKGLCLIDELIPSVVPRPRVALGVLVGHDGPDGLHDGGGDKVLRGNELQALEMQGSWVHQS